MREWARLAGRRGVCHGCAVAIAAMLVLTTVGQARARVFLTRDQALELAFGDGSRVERVSIFMTDEQLSRARELAGDGIELDGALVVQYVGQRNGEPIGTAYFDSHLVRTLQETVMVLVTPEGAVGELEILAFQEPQEYLPKNGWLGQFDGKSLDRNMDLRRGIHGITGATLSAQAVTDATRRVLAIHRALTGEIAGAEAVGGAQ